MKNTYQTLLVAELDKIKDLVGEAEMQNIYQGLKNEGQEAMSRELIIQLVSRYFGFWDRVKFFAHHRDLAILSLFRIKKNKKTYRRMIWFE